MRYRKLGTSELQVSEISLGLWLTSRSGIAKVQAEACVKKALELGINFIDTANVYGRGTAESFLGDVLAGVPRQSYVLATKLYFPMSATDRGLSAAQVKKQIDLSLRRLRTDYVDLYQCHRYDRDTPLEETMHALTEVVKAGKARYIGMSEWTAKQIEASVGFDGAARFVSSQPQYSMLWRAPEREVIPACKRLGISQIAMSPLAQGVLTGKYRPGQGAPPSSRAVGEKAGGFLDESWLNDDVLRAVERLKPIADRHGITLAQLALAWVLREPNVASAIVGATKAEQLEDDAKASGIALTKADLDQIDAAIGSYAER